MLPLIDAGTMYLLREADKSKIIGGNIYLLTFDNQTVLRIVRTKLGGATLVLEPINKKQYDEIEIQTATVTDCYEVTALFTRFS
ncbi:MAG: hypothetical protein LUD68_10370 [Rikenellaceae bacterium]|nr:hypothetical protein [Rikenellaceae bacterium]